MLITKMKDSPGEDGENRRVLLELYTRVCPEGIKVCLRRSLSRGALGDKKVWCRRGDSNPHPLVGD